jgi:hypothetical protein
MTNSPLPAPASPSNMIRGRRRVGGVSVERWVWGEGVTYGGGVTSAKECGRLIAVAPIVVCSVGGFSPLEVANLLFWQRSCMRK